MTNLTPFGALFIILLVFAFGDFVGVVTKAKVSTMFVIMATFLVLFMTHAIPADICTTANLTYVTSIGLQFLLVDMGSSVGLTELKRSGAPLPPQPLHCFWQWLAARLPFRLSAARLLLSVCRSSPAALSLPIPW